MRKPFWDSQVKMDCGELVICLNMDAKVIGEKDCFNWVRDLEKNFVHGNYE